MKLTNGLKARFCKNTGIPINIYQDDIFNHRINLFDYGFDSVDKLSDFMNSIKHFNNEQEYFAYYNQVKDNAISCIKKTIGYQKFCSEFDLNALVKSSPKYNFPSTSIYKPTNDKKWFISIDMKQANFNSLKYFCKDMPNEEKIFHLCNTWEDFIKMIVPWDDQHLINSKYLRQVILGNCNPGRHISYEKYLMSLLIPDILKVGVLENRIVSFTNDEIVVEVVHADAWMARNIMDELAKNPLTDTIQFKVELFQLWYLGDGIGYAKVYNNGSFKLKCVPVDLYAMVTRAILNGCIEDEDMIFYYNGALAKYISLPENIKNAMDTLKKLYPKKIGE